MSQAVVPEPVSPDKPGYKTTEFATVATVIVTNVIGLLVLLGYVAPSEQATLTQTLGALIAAGFAFVSNGIVVWKYVQSRTEVKAAAMHAQTSLVLERIHAASRVEEVRRQ